MLISYEGLLSKELQSITIFCVCVYMFEEISFDNQGGGGGGGGGGVKTPNYDSARSTKATTFNESHSLGSYHS